MIQYTSRLAYKAVIENLAGLCNEVYQCIANWDESTDGPGPSIQDIADRIGRKESSVCGRLKDLRTACSCDGEPMPLIREGHLKVNRETGKKAITWQAVGYKPEDRRNLNLTADRSGQLSFL